MRKITTLFFALSVVGSLSLTSCKDYSEDDYNTQMTVLQGMKDDLQQQINDLTTKFLSIKECTCQQVTITKNNDGTYTISNKDGVSVTVPVDAAEKPQADANGTYIIGADGKKIYIPMFVEENGKKYIQIGTEKYEFGAPGSEITIDGNKITIKVGDKTWEFDKTAGTGTTFEYDETSKTYTAGDGDKKITLPAGNYELKDNGDGTVTIIVGGQSATLVKKPVEVSVVEEDGNTVIVVKNYKADGTLDSEKRVTIPNGDPTPGTDISGIIKDLYGEGGSAAEPKEGSLFDRMDKQEALTSDYQEMKNRLSAVENRINDLMKSLNKLVTGIIVQQVYNPAFGSYNSLATNVQTNILVAYYGQATDANSFPLDEAYTGRPVVVRAGAPLLSDGDKANAGTVYLTFNPNTVDFTGFSNLKLVNSQDQESAVKLGTFKKSDAVLTSGYTRVEGNGFYEAPATIDMTGLTDPDVHLDIDKSAVKTALKDLAAVKNGATAKIALKDFAKVAIDVVQAMKLEALAVKCPWKDQVWNESTKSYDEVEHAVYSNYNMAAVAVQPLGFNSVDAVFDKEGNGFFWRAYDQIQDFVTRAAKKVGKKIADQIDKQFGLNEFGGTLTDIKAKLDELERIDMDQFGDVTMTAKVTIPEIKLKFDVPVTDQDINVGKIYVEVPDVYDPATGKWTTALKEVVFAGNPTVSGGKVHVEHTVPAQTVNAEVKMTKEEFTQVFQPIIANINNNYDKIEDVFDAFRDAIDQVNTMIDNINNLEDKLENATYLNRVFAYLDKFANKFANAVPALFKPVMLVSSDNGFGVAGFEGAPSTVAGQVTVVPTTYSAELLAPIYKRYIRVNDNQGQILDSRTLDITSQLKSGENTVIYEAMDYTGTIISQTYTLVLE